MRSGLFYILFVTFTLLFISSNQTRNKQLHNDIQSCQSIAVNTNIACILPEFCHSLKKVFSRSTYLKIIHKSLFEFAKRSRIDFSLNNLELFQKKAIAFIPLKQKILLLFLCSKSDKEGDHNLFE